MADTWPATLPCKFMHGGLADGMADGRLISQTDTGPAKVRRRSSAMPRNVSGQMIMTAEQLATMRFFIDKTLIGGSLPFNFMDPVTGEWVLVRCAGSMPTWSRFGRDRFTVSMAIEILP
jgi:hypothetical protein